MIRFILADIRRFRAGALAVVVLIALSVALCTVVTLQERAVRLGYVTPPASIFGMPRVDETRALEFFQDLYRGTHAHDPVNSLLRGIRSHFGESRTRYFVTSAIGFYRDPVENRFQPEDYLNIAEQSDGGDGLAGEDRFRIRGDVAPINVLEPVMWLAGNVGEP